MISVLTGSVVMTDPDSFSAPIDFQQEVSAAESRDTEVQQTVFLVDDEPDVRESMTFFLESFHLKVEAYESGQEFLDNVLPDAEGCAVVDIRMPGMLGTEVQQRLKEMRATFPVVMLSAHADVPVAVEAMKQGAYNFLLKSASQHEIIATIQDALRFGRQHRQQLRGLNRTRELVNTLSRREIQVADLVIEGYTSREISDQLNIKVKTVDAHRANLMRKMEASNVADLINKIVTLRSNDEQS